MKCKPINLIQEYKWVAGITLFCICIFQSCNLKNDLRLQEAGDDWPVYLGGNSSSHYSPLSQINKTNVSLLRLAWEYHTGDDVSRNRSQIQCNPLIINGILYGTSPKLKVFALDATSGILKWEFDPNPGGAALNVNRGVSYWEAGSDKRVLFSAGPDLFALDANTGKLIGSFGISGKVSLKEGLGDIAENRYVSATTPGIVYQDLLIIGSRVAESAGAAPGFIRAFNIRNGRLEWVFHTIPQPGEFGYDTWPEGAYKTAGGANCWAGMSLDQKRGIVYVPTGSASFDFWGGNRKGQNLFANCILALDAATGKRIWHYQTVRHDLWDLDLPSPPNLVTVTHERKKLDAVAQVTKSGLVFLFDRETGKELFPVEEIPVPVSDLEGEETWPAQHIPLLPPPLCPQKLTRENLSTVDPKTHDSLAKILAGVRTGQLFIPPSLQGTIVFPGFDGGSEWGGAAADAQNGILYVNSNIMPWILHMIRVDREMSLSSGQGNMLYKLNCAVCHGQNREGNPTNLYPQLKTLHPAYDKKEILKLLKSGKGAMPSFNHLGEKEKDALAAFLLNSEKSLPDNVIVNDNRQDVQKSGIEKAQNEIPYTFTGYNRFVDAKGYPAVQPPWGTITAVDLNEGTIKWQVPLGEFEELTKKGIPKTGTENYGGPVITAGGLLFIGASKDGYFRAFDTDTGDELWKFRLPAGGYATPSVYKANGKQYVVIACGGGKMHTHSGDSYVAFTLGEK